MPVSGRENAEAGERGNADQNSRRRRRGSTASRLEEARGSLPDDVERAADNRLAQARHRTEHARDAEKL